MSNDWRRVQFLINSLTDDEDLRQELWLHFLTGASDCSLSNHLIFLQIQDKIANEFQSNLEVFAQHPISEEADFAIQILDPFERQLIFLLVLGLSVVDIAEYKGISPIRVHQTIASIKASTAWQIILRDYATCHSKNNSPKKNGSA